MIVFTCSKCQTTLSVPERLAGKLVRCPTCNSTERAPVASLEDVVESATFVGNAPSSTSSIPSSTPPSMPPIPKPQAGHLKSGPPPMPSGYPQSSMGGGTVLAPPMPNRANPFVSGFMATRPSGRRYGFNCGYCSSRLEGSESIAAQDGQCPTCGNNITIPILDRYGRLIDPKSGQIIKQDPHPVHAYAAAGDRAPKILRRNDGVQNIQCPRCNSANPITSNNCKNCGMPFTMDGTTVDNAGNSNPMCIASLAISIIGLPANQTIIIPALAVVLGIIGISQLRSAETASGGRTYAFIGIGLGSIGTLIGILRMF